MSAIETMSMAEIRERYSASLSPQERLEHALACAREKRLRAEHSEEEVQLVRELEGLVTAAHRFKGKHLSPLAVRRIVERLYGVEVLEATHASPYRPQAKGRIERVSRDIAKGGAE